VSGVISRIGIILVLDFCRLIAFQAPDEILTNDHVVQMIEANMPASLIIRTINAASAVRFDATPEALESLRKAGADDALLNLICAKAVDSSKLTTIAAPAGTVDQLLNSNEPEFILRNFRSMFINASKAEFFDSVKMKAALKANAGFQTLGISFTDEEAAADTVLEVAYKFAWDYPFTLKHQNRNKVLLSGTGQGPFSGSAGASDVARKLIKELSKYRDIAPAGPVPILTQSGATPAPAAVAPIKIPFGIKAGSKIAVIGMDGRTQQGRVAVPSRPDCLSLDTPARLDIALNDVSIVRAADAFGGFHTVYAPWTNLNRIPPGTQVKVARAGSIQVAGALETVTNDGVTLVSGQTSLFVPRDRITKIRILVTNRGSRVGQVVGTSIGVLGALTMILAAAGGGGAQGGEQYLDLASAGGGALGGTLGGAVGGLFDVYQTVYMAPGR
jgi:hypothetical protein